MSKKNRGPGNPYQKPEAKPVTPGAGGQQPAGEQQITRTANPFLGVVLPVGVLIVFMLLILFFDPSRFVSPCENFLVIQLVYPFLFGALGAILGGAVSLNGNIPLFGVKWDTRVAGGIAAAVLGLILVTYVKPASCEPKHVLVLKNVPSRGSLSVQEGGAIVRKEYFFRLDVQTRDIQIGVEDTREATKTLKIMFSGAQDFFVKLELFRADKSGYQSVGAGCNIEATRYPIHRANTERLEIPALQDNNVRYEVFFNEQFFEEFEQSFKTAGSEQVSCFHTKSRKEGATTVELTDLGRIEIQPASSPFKPQRLWHHRNIRTSEAPPRTTAQVAITPDGEVAVPNIAVVAQNPVSDKPATVSQEPPPPVPQRDAPSGCNIDSQLKDSVSQYLSGDELDQPRRRQIYQAWPAAHCFVWPLVVQSTADSLERARAIKLTVNAIINNSRNSADLLYWQPSAPNKRDFSNSLPYLIDVILFTNSGVA